jgi:hypothetical protein
MTDTSEFAKLCRLIRVADVYTPFVATHEARERANDVWQHWIEEASEAGVDPTDYVGLVKNKGRTVGWISFDMLDGEKPVGECSDPIHPAQLISIETPVLDAIGAFEERQTTFFFALEGVHIRGSLTFQDLLKLPVQMALFALLITLENHLLQVIRLWPKDSFAKLSADDQNRIRTRWGKHHPEDAYVSFLEYTSFAQKLDLVQKLRKRHKDLPLVNSTLVKQANSIRNGLAHASGGQQRISGLLDRKQLPALVRKVEVLDAALVEVIRLRHAL